METNAFREKYLFRDNRNHCLGLLPSFLADAPDRIAFGFQRGFSTFKFSTQHIINPF
jgi:hypothetical protein